MKSNAFSLIELLTVTGIILILTVIAVPALQSFDKEADLNNSADRVINGLRLAQNKTLSSEGDSSWGVYLSTTTQPNQYILFRGISFSGRSSSSDQIFYLPESVEISQAGEVVFQRITGDANQNGDIILRSKTDVSKTRTIHVGNLTSPDYNRIKDSRHIHVDYSRYIATGTENLILAFQGTVNQVIPVADWEGEVTVEGSIQKIKITAHRLNQPDTQFSIHRDRRYNNKSLNISLSGDATGNLIEYSADGLIVTKSSIYASTPSQQ